MAQPSVPIPMKDFGYDISNYRDIYPPFGTLADFQEMLDKMHEKGMSFHVSRVHAPIALFRFANRS